MKLKLLVALYLGAWVSLGAGLAYFGVQAGVPVWDAAFTVFVVFFFVNASAAYVLRSRQVKREGQTPPAYVGYLLRTQNSDLFKAPWSNQSVSPIVRVGAAFFVLCGVFALAAGAYFAFLEGVREDEALFVVATFIGELYMVWLFGHVVLRGKAPAGWLPFRVPGNAPN